MGNNRGEMLGLVIVVIALAARLGGGSSANASYFLLAFYALFGHRPAIQAVALSWLFTLLNPGIAADAASASIGKYMVLLAAALSVLTRSGVFKHGHRVDRISSITVLFGAFLLFHSLLFSAFVDISVLKAISWTVAMATLFAAWSGLKDIERNRLSKQVFFGLVVLLLASIPLVGSPTGYLVNGTGFQGVLNHPQAFGSTMALLGAWAAGRSISARRPRFAFMVLFGLCFAFIGLSETRTAGIALILGIGCAAVLKVRHRGISGASLMPGLRSPRLLLVSGVVLASAIVYAPRIEDAVSIFISKSGRADVSSFADAYQVSRGGLLAQMYKNIGDRPFQGVGFGIASNPMLMEVSREPVLGLPTGAAVEKGVLPIAVLEEVGIFGLVATAAWLLFVFRASSAGGVTSYAVLMTAVFLNLGEATLFSPGGMGLLSLVLIGWTCACGRRSLTRG